MTASPWLAIIGIGEDGIAGLSEAARTLLANAALVAGGARHLGLAAPLIRGERLPWPSPIEDAFPALLARCPAPVAVLASGDPFLFGIGVPLARLIPPAEIMCIPAPSAFSLACARLGWALQDVATLSFCGRPVAALAPLLHPGSRILALSAGAATPAEVADLLRSRGFGPSRLHVLERLGGPGERIRAVRAADGPPPDPAALNLLAIEVAAEPGARILPLAPGLPDDAFESDGQLTKREVRAVTLSSLAPRRGELLWDIGGGSGSISIEWMLRHPANQAIVVERRPDRAARIARNALSLGVPGLRVVTGPAPDALRDLPRPDAAFVGGGGADLRVLNAAWDSLPSGGRLVANAVTVETEAALLHARTRFGGSMLRLSVERLDAVGPHHGFRPAMPVTQFLAVKP